MKRLYLMLLLMNTPVLAVYVPPIGIPAPPFGIDEIIDYYDTPGNRNTAQLTYYTGASGKQYTHYVNSDTGNDGTGGNYGTEALPREHLPEDQYIFPGSIIECHGSNPIYDSGGAGTLTLAANGTSQYPIFIRGVAPYGGDTPIIIRFLTLRGSYVILENFEFDFDAIPYNEAYVYVSSVFGYHTHHVSVRACYAHGAYGDGLLDAANSMMVAIGYAGYTTNNVVFYDNEIDAKCLIPPINNDIAPNNTGVGFGAYTTSIWILENDVSGLGGDSIGSGHGVDYTATYYYIGKNICHNNSENCIDVKEVEHFVISQNECYNLHGNNVTGSQANGVGIVIHYGPNDGAKDIWVIFNEIYDMTGYRISNGGAGIQVSSDTVGTSYFIGNIIHDIKDLIVKEYWWDNFAVGADTAALIQSRLVTYGYVDADGVVNPAFTVVSAGFKAEFDGAYPYFAAMDTVLATVRDGGANGNAYMSWASAGQYLINNVFYNNDNGVRWDYGTGQVELYNNIIGKDTAGGFLYSIDSVNFANTEIEYNLFYQPGGVIIDWGGTPYTVAELITNTTKGDYCLEGDPTFTDKANDDYSLQAGSPGIDKGTDAGTVNTIYNLYYSTYGVDIKVAYDGTARTSNWDMGAYEQAGAGGGAKYFVVRAD